MLGQLAQAWSGTVTGDITGDAWQLHVALSNLDAYAPDGVMGPTTVEIVVVVTAP